MPTRLSVRLRACLFALAASVSLTSGAIADSDNPLGPQGLSDADAGRIQYFIESWTENLHFGNMDEYLAAWTDNAVLAPPGHALVVGPKAIGEYMQQVAQGTMQFQFSSATIVGRDDLAVVANTIVWDVPGMNVIATERYNQLIVLRKDDAGAWKVHAMIYNAPSAAEE